MNDQYPLVSIGIPIYNGAPYLATTLDSIRQQTYPNIEIIIVDDASGDGSYELCRDWAAKNALSVSLSRSEINKGLPATCNIILSRAHGKFIQFLDQDDILLPSKISNDVELMNKLGDDTAFVYSNVKLINENGELTGEDYFERINFKERKKNELGFKDLIMKNFIPAPSVFIRAEYIREIGGYDETLLFQDWDMWIRLSKKYKIFYYDVCNVYYRIHSTSMMANRDNLQTIERNNANIRMIEKHFDFSPEVNNIIIRKLQELTIYSYFLGDPQSKKKMWNFLKQKLDWKIGLYFLMAFVGLKHPSAGKIQQLKRFI